MDEINFFLPPKKIITYCYVQLLILLVCILWIEKIRIVLLKWSRLDVD